MENNETGAHLSATERMGLMKSILQQVIDAVAGVDSDTDSDEYIATANRLLEDFILHIEAAGPDLTLNDNAKMLLDAIKNRVNLPPEHIAKYCAQMLGVLDMNENNNSLSNKVFIKKLNERLDTVLVGKGSLKSIYQLERHLGKVIYLENQKANDNIRKLCIHIEKCVADSLEKGNQATRTRFLMNRIVSAIMQNKEE